jgi:hypothetical protein
MVIPALILAEEDRHGELLDETREKYIFQSVRDLLEELGSRPMVDLPTEAAEVPASVTERAAIAIEAGDSPVPDSPAPLPAGAAPKVLCVPANDEADELSAIMLSHLLAHRGIDAQVVSFKTLASERLEAIKAQESAVVCVSAVPPKALLHARYLCNRLRTRHARSRMVIGLWQAQEELGTLAEKLPAGLAEGVVTSLATALARISSFVSLDAFSGGQTMDVKSPSATPIGSSQDLNNHPAPVRTTSSVEVPSIT